jgi:HD-like signal output (HDOD) protein
MWFIFLCLLVIIAVGLYLFFPRRNKKTLPAISKSGRKEPLRSEKKTDIRESASTHPPSLTQKNTLTDEGMIVPELEKSDQFKGLRKHIQDGIESIFAAKPAGASNSKKMLQLEDIDPGVKGIVLEQISKLKDFKTTYMLSKALDDPNTSMSQLSKLVITDPIVSGKILKVANSAYFGMEHKVNSISHALLIIGLFNLRNILFQEGLRKLLDSKGSMEEHTMELLWEHATLTSICSSYIQNLFGGLEKGTLFTMGLLHDVGKFVMTGLNPIKQTAEDFTKRPLAEFSIDDENEFFGINHALIGRLAFEAWGFSELIVITEEMHHAPAWIERRSLALDQKYLQYLLVLFLSDQVAKLFAGEEKNTFPISSLDFSYHSVFSKQKLLSLILDSSLFSEILKAKTLMKGYR